MRFSLFFLRLAAVILLCMSAFLLFGWLFMGAPLIVWQGIIVCGAASGICAYTARIVRESS
jgi:hypothetical protein